MCKRIQRKRHRGWKKPNGAIYVGRGSKWGNPFKLEDGFIMVTIKGIAKFEYQKPIKCQTIRILNLKQYTIEGMLDIYESLFSINIIFNNYRLEKLKQQFQKLDLSELKGKDLMCWCSLDEKCHADILLRLANG